MVEFKLQFAASSYRLKIKVKIPLATMCLVYSCAEGATSSGRSPGRSVVPYRPIGPIKNKKLNRHSPKCLRIIAQGCGTQSFQDKEHAQKIRRYSMQKKRINWVAGNTRVRNLHMPSIFDLFLLLTGFVSFLILVLLLKGASDIMNGVLYFIFTLTSIKVAVIISKKLFK